MLKIEKLSKELQEEVISLRAQGLPGAAIATTINEKYELDEELVGKDVLDFCNKRENNAIKVAKDKGVFASQMAKKYFDTISQLTKLNEEVWNLFYEIKKADIYKNATVNCPKCGAPVNVRFKSSMEQLKAVDRLMRQIEHVDEILGRVSKNALNITYNITDLTQKVVQVMPQVLENYENRGLIKIKNKKRIVDLAEANKTDLDEEVSEDDVVLEEKD